MVVTWTPDKDRRLLLALLAANKGVVKYDYDKIAALNGETTKSSVDHRFRVLKKEADGLIAAAANGTALPPATPRKRKPSSTNPGSAPITLARKIPNKNNNNNKRPANTEPEDSPDGVASVTPKATPQKNGHVDGGLGGGGKRLKRRQQVEDEEEDRGAGSEGGGWDLGLGVGEGEDTMWTSFGRRG